MTEPHLLTDRDELEGLFDELAAELRRLGIRAEIVMVGGSWMLWHTERAATRDVDSGRRFDSDLTEAIDRVGTRHDLAEDWLNDHAAAFWPNGARYDECTVVYQHEHLIVRTPAPEVIFVMKLYRADPQDREDLISLWPMCPSRMPPTRQLPLSRRIHTPQKTNTSRATSPTSSATLRPI